LFGFAIFVFGLMVRVQGRLDLGLEGGLGTKVCASGSPRILVSKTATDFPVFFSYQSMMLEKVTLEALHGHIT
jgi:hypothetical protein